MKRQIPLLILTLFIFSCESIKGDTKKLIHKTGETVGETVSEFGKGVSDGVENNMKYELTLSKSLIDYGLETGNVSVTSDSSGTDNKLSVYCIFNGNIDTLLHAKVLNQENKEFGRADFKVSAKKGEAFYIDFIFPKQTNIDRNSRIELF